MGLLSQLPKETHASIKNKTARAITHVRMDYQMKSIFGKMEEKGLIEQVPGTKTSNTAYRKKAKTEDPQPTAQLFD